MVRTRILAPAIATALASTVIDASANVVATEGGDQREPSERRIEGRIGMLLGGSDVGDADGFSLGLVSGLGYRIGDVTLRGRFDHYRVGDGANESAARNGRATRLGAAVRYSLANSYQPERTRSGVGVELWGEAGIGWEHVAWRPGGVLDRPSGELAIGFELDRFGERSYQRRRHIGYFLGFRTLIARGPATDEPAMCGGPCDRPTRPSRIDLSMFFEFGVHWGR